jgi:carboxypeptidase family protein
VLSFRQGSILAIGGPPVSVQGAIVDSTTGALLAGVQVRARRVDPLPTERVSGASDADGTYRLSDMAPGRYWIFFSRLGYWPHGRQVTLPGGTGITLDVPLRPRQPSP